VSERRGIENAARAGVMGMIFKTIIAFCIGAAALSAAQKYWMSAMMAKVDEVSKTDFLPTSTQIVPAFDPDELQRSLNLNRPMGVIPATHR
jgi:hypothetical protein